MAQEECNKEDCKYRSTNRGYFVSCDYILFEGHRRGCGVGDACDKYDPGPRINLWMKNFKYIQSQHED